MTDWEERLRRERTALRTPPPPSFDAVAQAVHRGTGSAFKRLSGKALFSLRTRPVHWGLAIVVAAFLVHFPLKGALNSPSLRESSRIAHGPSSLPQSDSLPAPAATQKKELPSGAVDSRTAAIVLDDGSRAVPTSPSSRLELVQESPQTVLFHLNEGSADFSVTPDSSRSFRVQSANVLVEVVGTRFSVIRRDTERVQVAVAEGRVRVHWKSATGQSESMLLRAGADEIFPPPEKEQTRETSAASWKQLAQRGKMKEAYTALEGLKTPLADRPEELLLAADVARQSGHPGRATAYLERLLGAYPGDPRASVAAYTLGKVQLSLSNPAKAARAFEKARLLAPGGALAEDALAHEAQAHRQAGAQAAARQAASRYLGLHPSGVHVEAMRSLANSQSSSGH